MNVKHIPEEFGFRNKDAEKYPEMIVVAMSFICNAKCIHCPNAATDFEATLKGKNRLMSWKILKEIVEQTKKISSLLRISSFGEILVHPDSIKMIEYILENKKDKNVALTTNGALLTKEKSERLMHAGIKSIEFSMDAASKTIYEKIRLGLNWETTLQNIEDCIEIRNSNNYQTKIMVSVIEQPDNEKQIDTILNFWKTKVDKVLIRKMLSFKGIIKRSKNYKGYMKATMPCPFLWERVVIDPKGDVRGCVSDVKGDFIIGNVLQQNLSTIWRSEIMEDYRKKHLQGRISECPACKDCVDIKYRSWNYNYFYALENEK